MKTTLLAVLALSTTLLACENPVVGDWESKDSVANEKNDLKIEDDDTGEATIYFYSGDQAYQADFDLTWTEEDDKIIFDMECQGDCSSYDFEMECTMSDDDDEMECDGDNAFNDYEFDWKRD